MLLTLKPCRSASLVLLLVCAFAGRSAFAMGHGGGTSAPQAAPAAAPAATADDQSSYSTNTDFMTNGDTGIGMPAAPNAFENGGAAPVPYLDMQGNTGSPTNTALPATDSPTNNKPNATNPADSSAKNKPSNNNNSDDSSSDNSAARQQVSQAVDQCNSDASDAESQCMTDPSGNSASLLSGLDAISRSMNSSAAGANCAQLAGALGTANSAMIATKLNCSRLTSACSSSCSTARSLISRISLGGSFSVSSAQSQCNRAASRAQGLADNVAKTQQAMSQSSTCAQDFANQQMLAQQQFCMMNPQQPQCLALRQDCSNPTYAMSNPQVCACTAGSRCAPGSMANAGTAPFQGANLGAGAPGSNNDSSGTGLRTASTGAGAFGGGDNILGDGKSSKTGDMNLKGDSSGGGGRLNGGANKPGLAGRQGPAPSSINTNVLAGRMGGGNTSFGSPAAHKADAVGSYNKNGSWIPPKVGTRFGVNLDQFRPNMEGFRVPASSIAGSDLLAANVNIWKQMNLHYISIMGTLQP